MVFLGTYAVVTSTVLQNILTFENLTTILTVLAIVPVCLVISQAYNKILNALAVQHRTTISRTWKFQLFMNFEIAIIAALGSLPMLRTENSMDQYSITGNLSIISLYIIIAVSLASSLRMLTELPVFSILLVLVLLIADYIHLIVVPEVLFYYTFVLTGSLPEIQAITRLLLYSGVMLLFYRVCALITAERDVLPDESRQS